MPDKPRETFDRRPGIGSASPPRDHGQRDKRHPALNETQQAYPSPIHRPPHRQQKQTWQELENHDAVGHDATPGEHQDEKRDRAGIIEPAGQRS